MIKLFWLLDKYRFLKVQPYYLRNIQCSTYDTDLYISIYKTICCWDLERETETDVINYYSRDQENITEKERKKVTLSMVQIDSTWRKILKRTLSYFFNWWLYPDGWLSTGTFNCRRTNYRVTITLAYNDKWA